jgi:hypothetical protein
LRKTRTQLCFGYRFFNINTNWFVAFIDHLEPPLGAYVR